MKKKDSFIASKHKSSLNLKLPLAMKISLIMLFVAFQLQAATGYAQKTSISISSSNTSVEEVLNQIEKNSDYVFLYNDKNINTKRIVSIKSNNHEIAKILNEVFAGTDVKYTIVDKQIILSVNQQTVNQENTIQLTGIVKDSGGEALIGVTVLIKGTNNGTTTGINGDFSVKAKKGDILQLSYIGYATQEIKVVDSKTMVVVLREDAQLLNEIVVTAMGIERKEKSLTYATQQVKSEELTRIKDANFINSLNGKVAGMSITPNAGGAGGASKILLRGNRSILGKNAPLIVLDGIPMTNNTEHQVGREGGGYSLEYGAITEGSDPLSQINPDDIESINVLKGANAAALYGSVAANGVLMITTKKGKAGAIRVDFSTSATFERPMVLPELQNTYGAAIENGNLMMNSWGPRLDNMSDEYTNYDRAHLRNSAKDDISELYSTGSTFTNSVSVSGGTEIMKSYFSYSNTRANGMLENNRFSRHNISLRQSYAFWKKKLNIDLSLNYIGQQTKNRPGGGTNMNPIYHMYITPRNIDMDYYKKNYVEQNGRWQANPMSIYVSKGSGDYTLEEVPADKRWLSGPKQNWAYFTSDQNNPYWLMNRVNGMSKEDRIKGYITSSYEILDGLKVQGRFSFDKTFYRDGKNVSATTQHPTQIIDYGIYSDFSSKIYDYYLDGMLSYNKDIKDLSISASTGYTAHRIRGRRSGIYTAANGRYDDSGALRLDVFPTAINIFDPRAGVGGGREISNTSDWDKGFFATGQFGYKDMVYVDASYRLDWYRAFTQFKALDKREIPDHYGYFSVGGSALLHSMIAMPEFWNYLKFRVSYSEVGNSIPNMLYSSSKLDLVTGAMTPSKYAFFENPIPENVKSTEVGFDASFFQNALSFEATFYNTLMSHNYLEASTGGLNKPVNTGQIRNRGVELSASYSLNITKGFMWRTGVNFSYNDNKILETYKTSVGTDGYNQQGIGTSSSMTIIYKKGGSYGDLYTTDFARNEDGSLKLYDGVPATSQDNEDSFKKYLGNMNAKMQLGWHNTFTYKGLSVYFLIDGKIGGKVISFTEAYLDRLGLSKRTGEARLLCATDMDNLMFQDSEGDWFSGMLLPDGQLVPIQKYYEQVGTLKASEDYVYNGTNFRLREVSIGYTFNNLMGAGRNLSFSLIGRNLFFLYKKAPVDPDTSISSQNGLGNIDIFNMPSARSFGLSATISF